jgi:hypothetical protein
MNVYSIDVVVYATAYIKAESEDEALKLAKELNGETYELKGKGVSDRMTTDPKLPKISLSPAMTCQGPSEVDTPELVEENV